MSSRTSIPEDLYRKVRENEERNQHSVNGEIISIRTAATASKRMPVDEILARAGALRAKTRFEKSVLDVFPETAVAKKTSR